MRLNQPIVGLVLGLFMPLIGFVVVYLIMGRGMSFEAFTGRVGASSKVAGTVITLSVLANLLPFLLLSRRRLDYAVKGVVIATMLYALLFVYVKFVA